MAPADDYLTVAMHYQAAERGITNVSLDFKATGPKGGAVLLRNRDDPATNGLRLLSVAVVPKKLMLWAAGSGVPSTMRLVPTFQGDTYGGDAPDIGYHYPILHYIIATVIEFWEP